MQELEDKIEELFKKAEIETLESCSMFDAYVAMRELMKAMYEYLKQQKPRGYKSVCF